MFRACRVLSWIVQELRPATMNPFIDPSPHVPSTGSAHVVLYPPSLSHMKFFFLIVLLVGQFQFLGRGM
ncbi:unnamed protein product, partial [Mycena citricolor]